MRPRFHVGYRISDCKMEVYKAVGEPTHASHGHLYLASIGAFRTKRGAEFMARYGGNNPHCRCVDDAERLARLSARLKP